jgi:hypothetical protein
VGLIILIYSILFIGPTISGFFPHLAVLHYLRRIEYMSLFFVGYYALAKKPKLLPAVIWTLALTSLGIIIYGIGQKFYGFPAFLTMNEEFAKGVPLRLPPTARIASTFGGHYDLAAFMVFVIPILGSLVFSMEKVWQKCVFFVLTALSLLTLLFTASRISFGVYLIAISVMLVWRKKTWLIPIVFVASFIMLNFVSTASDRFYKTLRFSDVVIDLSTGQPVGTLDSIENGKATVAKQESPAQENLPKGSEFIGVPPSVPSKPAKTVKTVELFTSKSLASGSGEIATVSGSFLIQKAFVYDISITTRLQAEWPNAINAFYRNVLLGSGFSTLSVATDGDYLRMLGETGVLGTLSFLGVLIVSFFWYFRARRKLTPLADAFVTGVFAGIIGLSVNAVLIDVFEASKVAFTLWMLLGMSMALLTDASDERTSYWTIMWRVLSSRVLIAIYLLIGVLLLYGRAISMYFVADDFTWLRWAASSTYSDLPKYFVDAAGFFYRPVPKLYYFFLYSVFWLKPEAYHFVSLLLFTLITILLFGILELRKVPRLMALLFSLLFASLAIHHENVVWISGASSLLSLLFVALAVSAVLSRPTNAVARFLKWPLIWLLSLGSACSYEGGMTAPLIVWCVSWFIAAEHTWMSLAGLLLIPMYWWMRTAAKSVPPSGDYNVRLATIVPNMIGNGIGYVLAAFGGPRAVDAFQSMRMALKTHLLPVSAVVVLAVAGAGYAMTRVKKSLLPFKESIAWVIVGFIALLPFIGLGGMSERYALTPSFFLVIALASVCRVVWQSHSMGKKLAVVILIILLMAWNIRALSAVIRDWQKASDVAQSTMLTLKANYFPLQDKQAFAFVNTPIKYGRAWIFPTGLTDAMWHMFKFNAYQWTVQTAPTVEDAFKIHTPIGDPVVLYFDSDMKLLQSQKTVKTIEESNP